MTHSLIGPGREQLEPRSTSYPLSDSQIESTVSSPTFSLAQGGILSKILQAWLSDLVANRASK